MFGVIFVYVQGFLDSLYFIFIPIKVFSILPKTLTIQIWGTLEGRGNLCTIRIGESVVNIVG